MNYYPVLIPTLNRYDHLKGLINSLKANRHSEKTELIIGLDYPISQKYEEGHRKIKEYLSNVSGFKKVIVFEREVNYGPEKNVIELQNYAYQYYDATIVSEDDNIVAPCFLDYMDKCLDFFKDDDSIVAIGGYMRPIKWSEKYSQTIVRLKSTYMGWGMGTWKRKDRDVIDVNYPDHLMRYVCSNRYLLKKLRGQTRLLYNLIFNTIEFPELDTKCDFTMDVWTYLNDKFVVYPLNSLVRNEGADGSGMHGGKQTNDALFSQKISDEKYFEIVDAISKENNKAILKDFVDGTNRIAPISHKQFFLCVVAYILYMTCGYSVGTKVLKMLFCFIRKKK